MMYRIIQISLVLIGVWSMGYAQSANTPYQQFLDHNGALLSKSSLYSDLSNVSLKYLDSIQLEHPKLEDSTFRNLVNESIDLLYEYHEESVILERLQKYRTLSIERDDSLMIADLSDYITEIYINRSDFDKALEFANTALNFYKKKQDYTNQGKVILKIAAIQYSKGDYVSSIETVFEAADFFKQVGSSKYLAFSYLQIGTTYLFIKQYEQARENLIMAKEQFLIQGDVLGAAMCEANIALVYLEEEDFQKALEFFQAASQEILKSNRNIAIAQVYQNIGISFFGLKEYDSTQLYLNRAIKINATINYPLGVSLVYLDYAKLMKAVGKLDSTIYYSKKALTDLEASGDISTQYELYKILGSALFEQNKKDEAAQYMRLHILLEDSIAKEDKYIEDIAYRQDAKMKVYKEQLLIEKQENELYDQENSHQKNLIVTLSFIGVLMIGLLILISLINQRNVKLNKRLKANQKTMQEDLEIKNALLKEIHHRVKNNLQVISSILNIQGQFLKDEKLAEVINECKNRIGSMALIHESLYHKDPNDITSTSTYFKKLITQLVSTYYIDSDKITLNLDIEDVKLGIDQSIPCGLLVNEILSNVLKHAFPEDAKGEIDIRLSKNNQTYRLLIKDNGIGLPDNIEPEKQDTFGFLLIYTLVEQLEGQLNLIRKDGLAFHISWNETKKHQESDVNKTQS